MSDPARGSMERGGGAPSKDGGLTAESIVWAAIPMHRSAGRIPNALGPLLRRYRCPRRGIDGNANAYGRRREVVVLPR